VPKGYNYIQLDPWVGYHETFDTNVYDAAAAEAALAQFEYDGFNMVRVFLDHRSEVQPGTGIYGIAGLSNATGLYAPFVANFVDFLRRARAHHVYVIPVLPWAPANLGFQTILNSNVPANVEDVNILYLAQGGIDAKKEYAQQLAGLVAAAEAGGTLLSTVFSWELDNESAIVTDKKPFSLASGTVTPADGVTYNLAVPAERQQCFDANLVLWANTCAAAIRTVDPDAMVSTSVFTYSAVGRSGPDGIPPFSSGDARVPARPQVLRLYSTLSYTDIHLYPTGASYSIVDDLGSSEFAAFQKGAMPMLMGEFGAFKTPYPNITSAAVAMGAHRAAAFQEGFGGSIFWTWNTSNQPALWNAAESGGAINGVLAQ
jgi:hypothetical protein